MTDAKEIAREFFEGWEFIPGTDEPVIIRELAALLSRVQRETREAENKRCWQAIDKIRDKTESADWLRESTLERAQEAIRKGNDQ